MWSLIPILISEIGDFQLPPKSDSLFIQLMLSKYVVGTHLRYSRSESGAVVFLLLLNLMPLKEMVLDDAE